MLRVPFGYLVNLLGARAVFAASFFLLPAPVWFISKATTCQAVRKREAA